MAPANTTPLQAARGPRRQRFTTLECDGEWDAAAYLFVFASPVRNGMKYVLERAEESLDARPASLENQQIRGSSLRTWSANRGKSLRQLGLSRRPHRSRIRRERDKTTTVRDVCKWAPPRNLPLAFWAYPEAPRPGLAQRTGTTRLAI